MKLNFSSQKYRIKKLMKIFINNYYYKIIYYFKYYYKFNYIKYF